MNFLARLKKLTTLFLLGINILFSTISCVNLSKYLPASLFADSHDRKTNSIAEELRSIDGVNCIPHISSYDVATLINVIDGDSIRVAIQGTIFEVRYIGIDSPEFDSEQRHAAVEAAYANEKVLSSSILYLFKDKSNSDKYGRLLRYVISGGKFVNLELVRSGHAQAKTYFPDTSCHLTFDHANDK